jgi:hypothetical protein
MESVDDERLQELVIDYGDGNKAAIEVSPKHTLADARTIMMEEFDDDMFPAPEWIFVIDGLRITRKQESRKSAWDYCGLGKEGAVVIRSPSYRRSLVSEDAPPTKRVKAEEAPSHSENVEANANANDHTPHTPHSIAESHKSNTNDAHLQPSDEAGEEPPQPQFVRKEILVNDDHIPTSHALNVDMSMDMEKHAPSAQAKNDEATSVEDGTLVDKDITLLSKVSNITHTDRESMIDDLMALSSQSFSDDESNKSPSKALADYDMDSGSLHDALIDQSPKPKTKKSVLVEAMLSSDDEDFGQKQIPDGDDEVEEVAPEQVARPYAEADAAMEMARTVLRGIGTILEETKEHELFCAQHRRAEWTSELKTLVQSDGPPTIIGVLGNTGV